MGSLSYGFCLTYQERRFQKLIGKQSFDESDFVIVFKTRGPILSLIISHFHPKRPMSHHPMTPSRPSLPATPAEYDAIFSLLT